jgi:ferric-dicitrate binding protein FerR (iron transport regulator)
MKHSELERNIQDLFEGVLTGDRLNATQAALRHDMEAQKLYKQYLYIHNGLQQQANIVGATRPQVIPIDHILRRKKLRDLRNTILATAAVILLTFLALYLKNVDFSQQPGVQISASPSARYQISHTAQNVSMTDQLEDGSTLKVTQGAVALTFRNGVESIVQAPATLTLNRIDSLDLQNGQAWFYVPPQAIGFQVTTKDLDIIDLGTEFGVTTSKSGLDEVHVFEGEVEVTAHAQDPIILNAGSAVQYTPEGELASIPVDTTRFHTSLPASLPYYHWDFNEINDGAFLANGDQLDLQLATAKPTSADPTSMHVEGKRGKAVQFSMLHGQEMRLNFSGPKPEQAHTIACWLKLPAPSPQHNAITSWSYPDSENRFGRWAFLPVQQNIAVYASGRQISSYYLTPGKWHHVAYVYNGTADAQLLPEVRIFINGAEKYFQTRTPDEIYLYTDKSKNIAHPFTIGAGIKNLNRNQPVLNASIDELFYIEGALTRSQIRTLADKNTFND